MEIQLRCEIWHFAGSRPEGMALLTQSDLLPGLPEQQGQGMAAQEGLQQKELQGKVQLVPRVHPKY